MGLQTVAEAGKAPETMHGCSRSKCGIGKEEIGIFDPALFSPGGYIVKLRHRPADAAGGWSRRRLIATEKHSRQTRTGGDVRIGAR